MNLNEILKIIVNIIINLIIFILGLIAIIAIWTTIQLKVQKKEYVDIFGYSIFSTATGSMSPTIEIGDLVVLKLKSGNDEKFDLKEQDIITYKKNDVFITHRIIKIEGESIIAKGDANNTEDEAITRETIIGKVIFISPKF